MHKFSALIIVIIVTMVGFALRLHNIGESSFRGDEAFTVMNWVQKPLFETLNSEIVVKDPQPPLTYAVFRAWGLMFGSSEFSIRILPALLNVMGIPVLYALGHRLHGPSVGVLSALLWAFHPYLIWHSQDAKMYAGWVSASAAAIWLALRALEKQRPVDWLLYTALALTAAYLYYLELFTLAVLNLFILIAYWRRWKLLRSWIISQIVIGLLLAPWFLQERLLVGSGYGGTTPPQPIAQFITALVFGTSLPADLSVQLFPIIIFIAIGGCVVLWRRSPRAALLTVLLATFPILLLALVSLRLDVFTPRYILATIPAYILWFAAFVIAVAQTIRQLVLRRVLLAVMVGAWLLVDIYSLNNYYNVIDYAKAKNWRGLANYMYEHVQADDWVIQLAADEALTFYYADTDRLPANPQQPAAEITTILDERHHHYQSLWLVGSTFPDWPNTHVVPAWMAQNMQLVRETAIDSLPIWQYMPWQVQPEEVEETPKAVFGDIAKLMGVSITAVPEPTGEQVIWAYWRPLRASSQELKLFVHLVGAINPDTGTPLWAQDDQYPQEGRISTTTWLPDQIYRDVYTLDMQLIPPGEYRVLIGLYDPQTNNRQPVGDSDSYEIGKINLP